MSARKRKEKARGAQEPVRTDASRSAAQEPGDAADAPSFWGRDNIENFLVAVILALLFRGFEAEAFVIPTGSMAPTLMGRHKDLRCDECGFRFQTGESLDPVPEGGDRINHRMIRPGIDGVVCPNCRYSMHTPLGGRRFVPYTGDRILVNKFAYQTADPERWDVIVFKYPGNAKQNYIKRLVGLPNETLTIRHGDVFTSSSTEEARIARKPPR
ncbi:MAG TPA: signal peptidase I, partial [Pirellulaceae bacterium]